MRAEAVYRALLHCYPTAFRHEYGGQMALMFVDQLNEARRAGGRLQEAGLWLRAAWDALTVAPREHWHIMLQDLRYALRTMAARPSFAVVAVLSLALGIGANTAIFSLWNGVLLAPLPAVDKPEQLVMLSDPNEIGMWTGRWDGRADGPRAWLTFEEFEALRERADLFSGLMASESSLSTWQVRVEQGQIEEAHGRLVSDGYFSLLGVHAAIGRVYAPGSACPDDRCAVISHAYWRRRFGGDAAVLGKVITIRREPLTIIGVTPPGFIGETGGQEPDLWLPMRAQPAVLPGLNRLHDTPPDKVMWLHVFGRLKPGVTLAQAESQANTVFQSGLASFYGGAVATDGRGDYRDERLTVRPAARGATATRNQFSESLTALLAGVGVLLLIACFNLANLLLARGAARRSEIALRLSLGASRERIVRQLVTESLLLSAIGGVAAVAVASVFHGVLMRMLTETDDRFHLSFALDPVVVAFVIGTTVAAAVLFGVLPAWQVTKGDASETLREQGRGSLGSLRQMRSGKLLVSLQLALSLPLLIGAGLLARTVYNLQHADLGFPAARLLLLRVDAREAGYDGQRREALVRDLRERLQQVPGVRAVSYSQLGIFTGGESGFTVAVEGYTAKAATDRNSARDAVGPGYFSTLGVPIRLGRELEEQDSTSSAKVCVINESFARLFFEGRNPIGMSVSQIEETGARQTFRVVGVAGNAHTQNLRGEVKPRYFVTGSDATLSMRSPTFLIRTSGDAASVIRSARRAIELVDASLPIIVARPLEDEMAPLTAQDRTTAKLAAVFGGVALVLAAIGLYGVLSYGIARRTAEIAIRIALGARPGRVVSMILRETSGLVAAGLVLGGALAYAASRVVASRLYGVDPGDPITAGAAIGILVLVALAAAFIPARRASRLDPITALRQA